MSHKWKIRVNDGFCEYEYELLATNPKVSIHDIYDIVRKKLKAEHSEGKYVSKKTGQVVDTCNY